jgi:hypothetical protein
MTRWALLLAAMLPAPAFAAEDPDYPPVRHEISENQFYAIGACAMAGAAWLAYDAGDDAEESQRNLRTLAGAFAVVGAAFYLNGERAPQRLALVPAAHGALLRAEIRFGG